MKAVEKEGWRWDGSSAYAGRGWRGVTREGSRGGEPLVRHLFAPRPEPTPASLPHPCGGRTGTFSYLPRTIFPSPPLPSFTSFCC